MTCVSFVSVGDVNRFRKLHNDPALLVPFEYVSVQSNGAVATIRVEGAEGAVSRATTLSMDGR